MTALAGMAKPVIAAVNGVAAGAGASLAFACDLRIVADTAGFNLAFANVALSCDTGASYHLQQLVGRAKAMELLYFPRTIRPPRPSSSASPPRSCPPSRSRPRSRAGHPPGRRPTVALGAMRRSVAYAAGHSFEEALELESAMMTKTGATADHPPPSRRSWPRRSRSSRGADHPPRGVSGSARSGRAAETPRRHQCADAVDLLHVAREGCRPYSTVSAVPSK